MDMPGFLQLATMERLLKEAGAARVSDKAKAALKEILEELGLKIGADAVRFAAHSRRKTVKSSDVRLAAKGRMER